MAFDAHKNFATSLVATAPSPATSGTSLVVTAADGTKFPTAPFNATVWPAGVQPTITNAEIVRVTAISTDTFTITRTQEGTSARTIVVGDQIAVTITKKTLFDIEGGVNGLFDYVISGCVWSGDAYASTKVASMTAGTIWLNGVQLTVAAVTSRTFTASKDVYVDFSDNGDGTAVPNYTDNTTNAASPALTAGRLRNAIIVVGASSIAAATSVNQGQETMLLPIASSIPYAVTDSLGNLICPRDPTRRLLGYRQITSAFTTTNTTQQQVTGLTVPVIIPTGRKIKICIYCDLFSTTNTNVPVLKIWDGVVVSGTALNQINGPQSSTTGYPLYADITITPTSTTKTYNLGLNINVSGTAGFQPISSPSYMKVELA